MMSAAARGVRCAAQQQRSTRRVLHPLSERPDLRARRRVGLHSLELLGHARDHLFEHLPHRPPGGRLVRRL